MPNTYTELATQTLGAATGTVTFSSIPSGYTDLVLVANIVGIGNISAGAISIRFNSDTATNYSATYLMGNGSSATSGRASNDTRMIVASPTLNLGNNPFVNIVQIQNYSNTTTFKTVLSRSNIAATQVAAVVGLWRKTPEAITSITYESYNSQTMSIGSTFSLYGIANADQGAAKATGGIITEDSQYWYHTFGASSAFIPKQSLSCDILVIAGGGGGGSQNGGGGGAGGLLAFTSQSLTATSYNVTVGGGGNGAIVVAPFGSGINGSDSQFGSLTLVKGGGGGGGQNNGTAPGSQGSGGGASLNGTGGTATSGQGNNGGSGSSNASGGGGGAGAVGTNAPTGVAGSGGNGLTTYSSWGLATGTGQNINNTFWYAGGGAGIGSSPGTAGNGGGGLAAVSGIANTGGGGGGWNGITVGAGGSGIVIVRYAK